MSSKKKFGKPSAKRIRDAKATQRNPNQLHKSIFDKKRQKVGHKKRLPANAVRTAVHTRAIA